MRNVLRLALTNARLGALVGLVAAAAACGAGPVRTVSTTSQQIGYSIYQASYVLDVATLASQQLRPPGQRLGQLPVVLAPGGRREAYIGACPLTRPVTCGLYVADRGGAHARRVWTMSAPFESDEPPDMNEYPTPAWSPDGSEVAFADPGDGNLGRPSGLIVAAADGRGVRRIDEPYTPANDEALAWSPDGSRLAFWAFAEGLVVTTVRTGSTSVLPATVSCQGFALSWAPDGRSLLGDAGCPDDSVSGSTARAGLFRFSLASATTQPGTALPTALLPADSITAVALPPPPPGGLAGSDDLEAQLSPDGSELAVLEEEEDDQEPTHPDFPFRIFVVDEATGAIRTVATGNAYRPQLTGWVRS